MYLRIAHKAGRGGGDILPADFLALVNNFYKSCIRGGGGGGGGVPTGVSMCRY